MKTHSVVVRLFVISVSYQQIQKSIPYKQKEWILIVVGIMLVPLIALVDS